MSAVEFIFIVLASKLDRVEMIPRLIVVTNVLAEGLVVFNLENTEWSFENR